MYVFGSAPSSHAALPHFSPLINPVPRLALIDGLCSLLTHAPPDVRKLPPVSLPVLSFPLFSRSPLFQGGMFSPSPSHFNIWRPCRLVRPLTLNPPSSISSFHSSRSVAALGVASAWVRSQRGLLGREDD